MRARHLLLNGDMPVVQARAQVAGNRRPCGRSRTQWTPAKMMRYAASIGPATTELRAGLEFLDKSNRQLGSEVAAELSSSRPR